MEAPGALQFLPAEDSESNASEDSAGPDMPEDVALDALANTSVRAAAKTFVR